MRKIKAESLKALNLKLDIVRVLEEMGVADIADTHPEVLSTCPFHAGNDVEAVLTVEKKSRTAVCDESQCVVASGESLLAVYSRATGRSLEDSASYWAASLAFPVEYEDAAPAPLAEAAMEPEPVLVADPEDTEILGEALDVPDARPDEAVAEDHADAPSGEIDAEDLVMATEPAMEPAGMPDDEAPASAAHVAAHEPEEEEDVPPLAPEALEEASPAPSVPPPATSARAQDPAVPAAPPGPEQSRDEEAVLRYLLGDDPGAMLDVASHGVTEHDFRGGGTGTPGLSLHGAIFSAFRRANDRRQALNFEAVLPLIPESCRAQGAAALTRIGKGTTTDRKRFRQALRRLGDAVMRENLENALRASLTDLRAHAAEDPTLLLRHALERIQSVGRQTAGPLVVQDVALPEILDSVFDREEVPIPTFSDGLNKLLNGGLQFGHLAVLTGGPGCGKTALLLQMADGLAAANGPRTAKGLPPVPVVFVTTSSARRHLTLRSLARLNRMNAGALQSKRWVSGWEGDFLESEIDIDEDKESVAEYYARRVREAAKAYRPTEPYLAIVEASPWTTVDAIRGHVLQVLRKFSCHSAVLIVDTLHHVIPGDTEDRPAWNDSERLEAVGARLKHLAMTMRLPVIGTIDAPTDRFAEGRPGQLMLATADIVLSLSSDEDIMQAGNVTRDVPSLSKRAQAFRDTLERIREQNPLEFSHSEYAVVEPLKHRSGALNGTVFIFNKAWHSFEELEP